MSFHILLSRKSRTARSSARSLCLLISGLVLTTSLASGSITYTQDPNIHDFTSTVSMYAQFIYGSGSPYTPTSADVESSTPPLVTGHVGPVIVDFGAGNQTSQILIFNYIDHIGHAWDAYQPFRIYGSNDNVNYIQLSDALTASPADVDGVDQHFRLDTWLGIAPTLVNNTVSSNNLGYETYFDFSSVGSFRYYKFLYSTLTENEAPGQGEWEEELAGIGAAAPAPEPGSLILLSTGVVGLGSLLRKRLLG